jgi:hypothetical protein
MPTPTQQLISQTIYTTDGLTSDWNFSFAGGYIDASHVKAYYLDSSDVRTDVLAFTLSGPYQLHTTYVLPAGLLLVIYRDTPKTAPIVDFTDGSGLTELALDTNARQAVMLAAEAADANVNTSTIGASASAGAAAASALAASNSAISAQGSATSATSSAIAAAASAAEAAGAASGAGGDKAFFQNGNTINNSYTIQTGFNAGTFGPVTVAPGVVVTTPSGSTWTIV